jgi:CRP/FNR family transcriptional regulator
MAALDEPARRQLLAAANTIELGANEFVFHLGDACEAFVILLDGSVRVQLTSAAGREVTLYRIEPGGSCLLTTSCLFSHDQYPAEALTETPVRALAVPKPVFEALLEHSKAFRDYVFDGFAGRLTDVIGRIEAVALTPIEGRLAAALLRLHGSGQSNITHQALAVELGTAREVVSRHLKRMEASGWVELGRSRIRVIDRDALQKLENEGAV